ncbi:ArnT family glycosyltransferase [Pseudomarimonas arenosa]|uniref:Glycosyltransferase family 39 protein n=1 Tax=Pseudomarimonas arenosa TaxID=2774145 RepID=A0AAW3ZGJ9_9GAMM|nr:glycosyltransferase family 39 protein [Pseudomarimonas arenosa]MBD8525243.1 glycosyltransferase family 39 protein [Pseudomarimonas arenosa]
MQLFTPPFAKLLSLAAVNFLRTPTRSVCALLLLALLALAAGLGMRAPNPPDEPRFALAAKTMVETGHWLIPQRGSEVYAEKPATFMWMQAAFYALTGDLDIAFLLPSLLAGLLTLWLVADLAGRIWRPRLAPWALAALFISLQFGLQAKRGQIDMSLTAMTTVALWGLLVHFLRGPNRAALMLAGFAAGLGTVTKGVGFLPLLMLVAYAGWRSYARRGHADPATGGGWGGAGWLIPAFVGGAMIWLAPVLLTTWWNDTPELRAYTQELLFRQTGTRYLNAWHHHRPAWYYLQVIFTLWLPGALLLPWLLPAWWRRLRRGDLRYWLLLGWALLVLLFFSASSGKREVYIFPALPALALAAAPLLPGLLRLRGVRWTLRIYIGVVSLLGGLLAVGGWVEAPAVLKLTERRALDAADLQRLLLGFALLSGSGLIALIASRGRRIGTSLFGFTVMVWISYGLLLGPALDASSSGKQLMAEVGERLPAEAELGIVDLKEQLLLQADRPVQDFGYRQPLAAQWVGAVEWLNHAPQRRWLLVRKADLPDCLSTARLQPLGRANRVEWSLLPGHELAPSCAATLRQAADAQPSSDRPPAADE